MGILLQSGQQAELTGINRFTGAFNQSETSVGLVAVSGYTDIITVAVTNAQANYNYLIVTAGGYVLTQGGTCEFDYAISMENTIIGASILRYNQAAGQQYDLMAIERILTAGTDYVKGTGFTAKLRANAITKDCTVKGQFIKVVGVM